ncbi:MAG: zf-HC2 domain-containing protein [Longimicrobiales bacterium]
MNEHVDFETLQDYREGLLPSEASESVRAHLEACGSCRGELEALADLMGGLEELPREAQPGRDLWPQIEWRIGSRAAREEPAENRARPGRQITFQAWQLLAASITVALLSGGAVWAVLTGGPRGSPPAPVASAPIRETLAQPVGWEAALDEYDQAVADLEGVLEMGKGVLDPATVQILEENLLIIDRAIAEAQEALALDPASGTLGRFLAENLKRKIDLLRQAATAVYANS